MDEDFRNNFSYYRFLTNTICHMKVCSTKPYIILICLSCLSDPKDHAFWKRSTEAPLYKDWCVSLFYSSGVIYSLDTLRNHNHRMFYSYWKDDLGY